MKHSSRSGETAAIDADERTAQQAPHNVCGGYGEESRIIEREPCAKLVGGSFIHRRGRSGDREAGGFIELADVAVLHRLGGHSDVGDADDAARAAVIRVGGAGDPAASAVGGVGGDGVVRTRARACLNDG